MVCVCVCMGGGVFLVNILNDCLTVVRIRISQCHDSAYTQHNNYAYCKLLSNQVQYSSIQEFYKTGC